MASFDSTSFDTSSFDTSSFDIQSGASAGTPVLRMFLYSTISNTPVFRHVIMKDSFVSSVKFLRYLAARVRMPGNE
jgi:hypothetical protein